MKAIKNSNSNNNLAELFFQTKPCLESHVHALLHRKDDYVTTLMMVVKSGTWTSSVSSAVRARVLVAMHLLSQHSLLKRILQHCDVVEVLKMLQFLDRNRKMRQLTKKIQEIEQEHPHLVIEDKNHQVVDSDTTFQETRRSRSRKRESRQAPSPSATTKKPRRVELYRQQLHSLKTREGICQPNVTDLSCQAAHVDSAVKELIEGGSVSGALARKVREWAKTTLRTDYLEFVLLGMPPEPWKQIADIVHFRPTDFAVPYFLTEIHSGENKEGDPSADQQNIQFTLDEDDTFVSCMRKFFKQFCDYTTAYGQSNSDPIDLERREEIDRVFIEMIVPRFGRQIYLNYPLLRRQRAAIVQSRAIMQHLAAHVPLDTVLWHYEEFHGAARDACQDVVIERLQAQ